jgi:7,8-dihydroneopterin aldolase/epimerase/oxygenase
MRVSKKSSRRLRPSRNEPLVIERIHIEQLAVRAHVGVPADERKKTQRLTLNVSLQPRATMSRDELEETVNYSEVANVVKEIVGRRDYKLIETLAESIAAELLERFNLRRAEIEVRKFVLADARFVSVTAVREAESLEPRSPATAA